MASAPPSPGIAELHSASCSYHPNNPIKTVPFSLSAQNV